MPRIRGDRSHPDKRTMPKVQVTRLGDRDFEPLAQFRDNRPYGGSLLFERLDVSEEKVQLKRSYEHGITGIENA